MSRRPARRSRTARMLPGARRRETSRLTGKTVSRPEFPVSRLGFPVSRPAASPVGPPFMTPGARGGTRCRPHFARRHPHFLQHSGWFRRSSGRHKWRPYVFCAGRLWVAAAFRAFSVAVVDRRIVGAPFMTPGARGGIRRPPHGTRRYPRFLRHSGRTWRSSGRHKWRPYVFLCRASVFSVAAMVLRVGRDEKTGRLPAWCVAVGAAPCGRG